MNTSCWMWPLLSLVAFVVPAALAAEEAKESVAAEGNRFAADLYGQLAKPGGNLFFSPYSIRTALAMTYAGARGQTAHQLADVLHFSQPPTKLHEAMARLQADLNGRGKGAYDLVVANALWGQKGYPFHGDFQSLLQSQYGAGLHEVDFAQATEEARQQINGWVEKQTRDKIKDLIARGALSPADRLVLTNAIYFKGKWEDPFTKTATQDQPFHVDASQSVQVPLMHRLGQITYMENEQLQAVELPYFGDSLSMVVLLPRKPEELGKLENNLSDKTLEEWVSTMARRRVDLCLPRFQLTQAMELADTLKTMGMTDAFSDKADFSGIATVQSLCIGHVIHKAYVDVNEEGTEAAAATGITMMPTAKARPPTPLAVFRADHPFVFLIRDRTSGTVLFMGRVARP